ncbi:MAG: hypothetical protein SFX18_09950 [Pirellulales bacterium]|nr:hypothetical protein [Pirellulales bacterium]
MIDPPPATIRPQTALAPGRRGLWPTLIVGVWGMAFLGGCALFQPAEPENNFRDDFKNWGQQVRPAASGKNRLGLSSEAQQIEKNLGY